MLFEHQPDVVMAGVVGVLVLCGVLVRGAFLKNAIWDQAARFLVIGSIFLLLLIPFARDLVLNFPLTQQLYALGEADKAYRQDIERLRAAPGEALYEDPLLGYYAGKKFVFDPFNGTQMMVSGRIPEAWLTDAIRQKRFGAIVLWRDAERSLNEKGLNIDEQTGSVTHHVAERWTDNVQRAVVRNYVLSDSSVDQRNFFYYPRQ